MPLTFEALKGQRYRWCFGGIQILRVHWRSLLAGRATRANHMTTGQRWPTWRARCSGTGTCLACCSSSSCWPERPTWLPRRPVVPQAHAVPGLGRAGDVLLGLVRAIALLRRGTGASWRDALGAFFIWQSTSLVVARASVLGLFAKKAVFLRTPKTSEQTRWWEALRANWPNPPWRCSASSPSAPR